MADLGGVFDATTVPPAVPFDAIPAGKYLAMIVSSVRERTKAGTGELLKLEFAIVDGEFKERKLFARLNLWNPSEQAVQIALRELSAICHAVGKLQVPDTVHLHNIPLTITVAVDPPTADGKIYNSITGYEAAQAPVGAPVFQPAPALVAFPAQQQFGAPAAAAPAPAKLATPPWMSGSS